MLQAGDGDAGASHPVGGHQLALWVAAQLVADVHVALGLVLGAESGLLSWESERRLVGRQQAGTLVAGEGVSENKNRSETKSTAVRTMVDGRRVNTLP